MVEDKIDWDEYYGGPSRSQQRREALDILALAKELSSLSPGELDLLPLNDSIRHQINEAKRITSDIAHKRQVQLLAKFLRKYEEDLPAIRTAVDAPKIEVRRANAQLHRIEQWRDRLIAQGDEAITAFLHEHPAGDRQQLRRLVRQANTELKSNKPPASARQLFRLLREWLD